eukprot:CAMPEP_0185593826 /NCGR_PEP_ID=MMETSP0434-20130131/72769_1 /TAXON_ID=626734 ORGANISM="Favella taraikaensis, Strain Fe Narragansett Bay" /NCGR_SAMPLE_ID=MMETSP0434 /ASSEMBLY_ACC=CAM_ASM_000379 /LENGTH=117 /DNA_ID=CAMNT_0028220723 /DNA_START=116 /DNA_END=469 /DNA_ORIENTATION=+
MTHHTQQLRLESQIIVEKNRTESLESYTSTISHEFRTPLSTTLMLLESILRQPGLTTETVKQLNLIVSALNQLLCLVNDVLDMKLINVNKYEARLKVFNPAKSLHFIKAMFRPQAEM